jgi:hypothetical protein
MDLSDLIARVEKAEGPDRELDRDLADAFGLSQGKLEHPERYSSSIDAAVSLAELVLPGWGWRVATCSVSDDAWLFPDFNCPIHGNRLRAELGEAIDWIGLTDIDRRPSGQPALAIVAAILRTLQAQREAG